MSSTPCNFALAIIFYESFTIAYNVFFDKKELTCNDHNLWLVAAVSDGSGTEPGLPGHMSEANFVLPKTAERPNLKK